MNCWLCNAALSTEPITRLVATEFHFWMRLCPECTKKYAEPNAAGELVYQAEKGA